MLIQSRRLDGRLGFAVAFTHGRHQVDMIGQQPMVTTGKMTDGDEILYINGQSTQGLSHPVVVQMLKDSGSEVILHLDSCATSLARLVNGGIRSAGLPQPVTMSTITTNSLSGPRDKLVLTGASMETYEAVKGILSSSVERYKSKSPGVFHFTLKLGAISGTIFAQNMARAITELERNGWLLFSSIPSGPQGDVACFNKCPPNLFCEAWCAIHLTGQRITILDAPRDLLVKLLEVASSHVGHSSNIVHRYDPGQEVDQLALGEFNALSMLPTMSAMLDSMSWTVIPITLRKNNTITVFCRPPATVAARRQSDWVQC